LPKDRLAECSHVCSRPKAVIDVAPVDRFEAQRKNCPSQKYILNIFSPPPTGMMQLIRQIASDEVLEQAFLWVCCKRKAHSHNNDVWNLRRQWKTLKLDLQERLLNGSYRFNPNGPKPVWATCLTPVPGPPRVRLKGTGSLHDYPRADRSHI
jgi:hypothetical protein